MGARVEPPTNEGTLAGQVMLQLVGAPVQGVPALVATNLQGIFAGCLRGVRRAKRSRAGWTAPLLLCSHQVLPSGRTVQILRKMLLEELDRIPKSLSIEAIAFIRKKINSQSQSVVSY